MRVEDNPAWANKDLDELEPWEWWACEHPERPFDHYTALHCPIDDCHGCKVAYAAYMARGGIQ